MDLSITVGAVEEIDLAGEPVAVRPLNFAEWGRLTAWLKRQHPSPLTRAALAVAEASAAGTPLPAEAEERLYDHAQKAALSWPPRLGSVAWFDAIESVEAGPAHLLGEVLTLADPAFDRGRVAGLVRRMRSADWAELFRVALWGAPPRPKAPAAAAAAAAARPRAAGPRTRRGTTGPRSSIGSSPSTG
jgi:hypothetical protein